MKIDPKIKLELKNRLLEVTKSQKKIVRVVTAYRLSKKEEADLCKKIPILKNAVINYEVNKNILAGYVIKIGSKVIDLSLLGQLKSFQNLFYEID